MVPNTWCITYFQRKSKKTNTRDFEGASRCRLSNSKASRGMAQMSYLDPACPPKNNMRPPWPLYSGWWLTYPSEKYESQLGWLFPIYGKIQTIPSHQPNIDCIAMCHGQNMPLFLAIGHYASLMVREDHPAIFQYIIQLLTVTCMSFLLVKFDDRLWFPACVVRFNIFTSTWALFGVHVLLHLPAPFGINIVDLSELVTISQLSGRVNQIQALKHSLYPLVN